MASLTHLDTHVVAWLYAGVVERFPAPVRERLESDELAVSPMVGLELQYLYEIGRLTVGPGPVLADLARRLGLRLLDASLDAVARQAHELSWTRDPFDRMLVAHAVLDDAELVTADRTLRANVPRAVWG